MVFKLFLYAYIINASKFYVYIKDIHECTYTTPEIGKQYIFKAARAVTIVFPLKY